MASNKDVLVEHLAFIKSDSADQARLRLGQALWRERAQLPIGRHERPDGPVPLGSRVDDDPDDPVGRNFLTPAVVSEVQRALSGDTCGGTAQPGRLISEARLWTDLLSSQPLAFNLFGELAADLSLATAVVREVWGSQVEAVTALCFEWSPGRGDERYLGNGSAFDVFVRYATPTGGTGFVGIEVKYHENMRARAASGTDWYDENQRYAEVAQQAGVFAIDDLARVADVATRSAKGSLGGTPLQQIWFDHLLALSMLQTEAWDEGRFVFLHTSRNPRTVAATAQYGGLLVDPSTYQSLSLEDFVAAAGRVAGAPWLEAFHDRYLDPAPVDALLGTGSSG